MEGIGNKLEQMNRRLDGIVEGQTKKQVKDYGFFPLNNLEELPNKDESLKDEEVHKNIVSIIY